MEKKEWKLLKRKELRMCHMFAKFGHMRLKLFNGIGCWENFAQKVAAYYSIHYPFIQCSVYTRLYSTSKSMVIIVKCFLIILFVVALNFIFD